MWSSTNLAKVQQNGKPLGQWMYQAILNLISSLLNLISSLLNLIGLGLYQAKTPMTLAYSISVYLRRNRVLMPCELSESSSPDQAGSIQPSFSSRPLCDLLSLTNGLTDTWLQLLSTPLQFPVRSCWVLKRNSLLRKHYFSSTLALIRLTLLLNGFTECSCTLIVAIDQEAFKNHMWQVDWNTWSNPGW